MALVSTVTKNGIFSDFTLFFYDEGILKYEPHASIETVVVFIAVWIILVVLALVFTGTLLLLPGLLPVVIISWLIKSTVLKADSQKYIDNSFDELKNHVRFREISWDSITQLTLMQKDSRVILQIYYNKQHYNIGVYDDEYVEMQINPDEREKMKSLFEKRLGERFKVGKYINKGGLP